MNHYTDFLEIWYLGVFIKFVNVLQFWLQVDNNRHCTWRPKYVIKIKTAWKKLADRNEGHILYLTHSYPYKKLGKWSHNWLGITDYKEEC